MGCSNFRSGTGKCSSALTDDDFTYNGVTYTINRLWQHGGGRNITLDFVGLSGTKVKTALGALTLTVDGRKLAFSRAMARNSSVIWGDDILPTRWTNGQDVSVSLVGPPSTTTMAPPPPGPALQWARVNGAELALRFDKALDESSVPSASAFAVSVAGSARSVSSVLVRQELVTLTLSSAVSSGETVTVGYTPPSTGKLRLSGGGAAVAAFSGTTVTNDTKPGQRQVRPPPEPVAPLTARIASAPSEHRGKGKFKRCGSRSARRSRAGRRTRRCR